MSAVLSECGRYRYRLGRTIHALDVDAARVALFVMLNPSTADAMLDDPTIRRCIGFARRERCGRLEVVNLYAFRATDPADLATAADPIGPANGEAIGAALRDRGVGSARRAADRRARGEGVAPRGPRRHPSPLPRNDEGRQPPSPALRPPGRPAREVAVTDRDVKPSNVVPLRRPKDTLPADTNARLEAAVDTLLAGGGIDSVIVVVHSATGHYRVASTEQDPKEVARRMRLAADHAERER